MEKKVEKRNRDLLGISIFSLIVFLFTFIVVVTSRSKAEPPPSYKTSLWGVVINKEPDQSFKNKVSGSVDREKWFLRKPDNAVTLQQTNAAEKRSLQNIH